MKLYSIKDVKVGFMAPVCLQNDGVAIRAFSDRANDKQKNEVNTYADDKEFWCLGEFDENTGIITPCQPRLLVKAIDVIIKE